MSFSDCLTGKVESGVLKKSEVDRLNKQYNKLVNIYSKTMSDQESAVKAAESVVNAERSVLEQKRRNNISAALTQDKITTELEQAVKSQDIAYGEAVIQKYEQAYRAGEAVQKQSLRNMDQFVDQFQSGIIKAPDRSGILPIVREMLGEATGDGSSAVYGKALRSTFDLLHKRYKAAGGVIGKIDNWFPQIHARDLIKNSTFDEWYGYLRPRVDMSRMFDLDNGLPLDEGALKAIAKDEYENVITNGRHDMMKRAEEGEQTFGFGGDISQQRMSSRFWFFKDADSFLQYNNKFGSGDEGLYDSILMTVKGFSRDIGTLETLGAKPDALSRHLDLQIAARGQHKRGLANGAYQVLTGRIDGYADENWWTTTLGNTQNVMRSAMLGGAAISAISDAAFTAATAKLNGMSATKTLGRYYGTLNPASSTHRRIASQQGYVVENAFGGALADARLFGDSLTGTGKFGKLTNALSEFTMRASGLQQMTKGAADSLSMEFESNLANGAIQNTAFKNLNPKFRDALESHGIKQKDWELLKKVKPIERADNAFFLGSQEVVLSKAADSRTLMDLANKIDDMSINMRMIGTNEPTLRTRAITTGAFTGADVRKGRALRALFSSAFMFKGFTVSVMSNHVLPAFRSAKKGQYGHLATIAVGTTIMGMLAMQLKEVTKGKDTKDMSDPKVWGAAMMQGGGLGLFGDFLFSDYSRFGRDPISEFVLGPVGGLLNDTGRVFLGNFQRAIEEPEKFQDRFLKDTFNLVKRNTPAVNLWYSRLVLERLLLDEIERFVDPKFDKRTKAIENRMTKQTGQKYWWRKGESAPKRAPQQAEAK